MSPDHINFVFEFVGSILTWENVYRVYRDHGYAGLVPRSVVFFSTWGLWNLFFYPTLGQWWSFVGGVSLVIANVAWVGLLLYYGPKGWEMTNRLNALIVVLDQDTRKDDAKSIIDAIAQLRGVASVTGNVSQLEDHIAFTRARRDLEARLMKVLS